MPTLAALGTSSDVEETGPPVVESMDFFANGWGVVEDHIATIYGPEGYQHLETWLAALKRDGDEVIGVTERERSFTIESRDHGHLVLNVVGARIAMGGNAFNTYVAFTKLLHSLQEQGHTKVNESMRFHGRHSEQLEAALSVLNDAVDMVHPDLVDPMETVRLRMGFVLHDSSTEQRDPIHFSLPPTPIETGTLPDQPTVFVSSSGSDINEELRAYWDRNPEGRVYLAPGSKQIDRGIPLETLRKVHFLNCNTKEAKKIALGIKRELMETSPDQIPDFFLALSDDPRQVTPDQLREVFEYLDIPEVRMTAGAKGTFFISDGELGHCPIYERSDELIRYLLLHEDMQGVVNERTEKEPDFNGCGDTRLGIELALEKAGVKDIHARLKLAALFATIQTFNPSPNILDFPPNVIQEMITYGRMEIMGTDLSVGAKATTPIRPEPSVRI
jgi:hypothetical protein